MVDLVVVLEEMGRVVMPGPFFSTVDPRRLAIDLGGSDGAEEEATCRRSRAARCKATLAQVEESGRWDAEGIALPAKKDGGGFTLVGHQALRARRAQRRPARSSRRAPAARAPRASPCSWSMPRRRASTSRCSRPWIRRASSARSVRQRRTSARTRVLGGSARAGRCSIASSTAPRSRCAPRCAAARRRCSR